MYQVELIWNREFDWHLFGKPHETIEQAKHAAISTRDSGDGATVKKVRVVDEVYNVIWRG